MLLFQKRFHAGLLDGSVTLTFRQWDRPRVKPGGRYRCHPLGVLEVDAVDRVVLGDVSEVDAQRAGFSSRRELRQYLARGEEIPGDDLPLFRVTLHHAGDGDRVQLAVEDALTREDVEAIERRLARMDAGPQGAWTAKTLALIRDNPQRRAGDLADRMGMEKAEFKALVVRLKKLGLTQSFEVGYELSPRGRAFLRKSKWVKPARRRRR